MSLPPVLWQGTVPLNLMGANCGKKAEIPEEATARFSTLSKYPARQYQSHREPLRPFTFLAENAIAILALVTSVVLPKCVVVWDQKEFIIKVNLYFEE